MPPRDFSTVKRTPLDCAVSQGDDLDIRTLYYSSPLNDVDQQRHES
jgi:hypothetical protein